MECLIQNGALINAKNSAKCTPLHVGSANGRKEVVEYLIKYRALMDIPCRGGRTALDLAAEMASDTSKIDYNRRFDYLYIVDILLKNGAYCPKIENCLKF